MSKAILLRTIYLLTGAGVTSLALVAGLYFLKLSSPSEAQNTTSLVQELEAESTIEAADSPSEPPTPEPELQTLSEYEDMSADEFENLPEEVLDTLPAKFVFGKVNVDYYDFLERVMLYRKFYAFPDNPPVEEQIKAFQIDIGVEPTGQLTFEQFGVLGQGFQLIERELVVSDAAFYSLFHLPNRYASVTGTWEIIGENHAYPLNVSEITCADDSALGGEKVCTDSITFLDDTSEYSIFIMDGGEDEYEIVSWDDEQIVALSSSECRNNTLTINLVSEEVSMVTTDRSPDGCSIEGVGGTVQLPPLESPRVSVLRQTRDSFDKYYEEKLDETMSGWATKFRLLYEEFLEAANN